MRLRDIIGLIVALILAVGVAFLTRYFFTKGESHKKEVVEKQKTTRILVAGRKLSSGDIIKPGDLIWQEWPETAVTPVDLTDKTTTIEEFAGSVVRSTIYKGNPILREELVKKGDRGILAAVVAPGKRAVSIDVTAASIDSGLIFPGDYVDVILSTTVPTEKQQLGKSKTILRNIKVLAIDTTLATTDEKPKTVPHVATLEVTEPQAEVLMAGVKEGVISLSLHSLKQAEPGSTESQLPVTKEIQERKIILMRGKEKSEIQFEEKQKEFEEKQNAFKESHNASFENGTRKERDRNE